MRNLGVELPWPGSDSKFLAAIDTYAAQVGAMPKLVGLDRDWTIGLINATQMDGIISRGAVPHLCWSPFDPGAADDVNQPAYNLASIINGSHDSYLKQSAAAAKSYGKPFQLRFAAEFNGAWSPWGAGINGNTPAQFVQAWQHVVQIFRDAGVTNITWVWCPNVLNSGEPASHVTAYWPGSDWVDMLSMDGYNWGSADVWQTWTQVFGATYDALAALDPNMRIQVSETACNQAGGDKPSWITSAFMSEVPSRFPRITDVVWFDLNKECDWRVDSSSGSLTAYKAVVASPDWSGAAPVPPPDPIPPPPPPPPPPTVPAAPSLGVTNTGRTTISLAWGTVPGATSYTVHRSRYASFSQVSALTVTGTNVQFSGLARRTTYYFRARATNGSGASAWSPTVQARTS